jgi:hypothetical protein
MVKIMHLGFILNPGEQKTFARLNHAGTELKDHRVTPQLGLGYIAALVTDALLTKNCEQER